LLDAGALSARERELLILRVRHRCDCDYEWSVHVAGFSDAAVAEADLHATPQSCFIPLSFRPSPLGPWSPKQSRLSSSLSQQLDGAGP
jgi:hypothetical protein